MTINSTIDRCLHIKRQMITHFGLKQHEWEIASFVYTSHILNKQYCINKGVVCFSIITIHIFNTKSNITYCWIYITDYTFKIKWCYIKNESINKLEYSLFNDGRISSVSSFFEITVLAYIQKDNHKLLLLFEVNTDVLFHMHKMFFDSSLL